MKRYALTYWWFGLAGNLPSGLTGSPPPGVSGGRTGVAILDATDEDRAIEQFPAVVGAAPGRADFLALSVVKVPELLVQARGVFVDGTDVTVNWSDEVERTLAAAEAYGRSGVNEYVVTGTITGDDQRFVQRVSADRVKGAVYKVLAWLESEHDADDSIAEVWSVLESSVPALPGVGEFRVYEGTERYRGPGQVSTSGASWMAGEFEEVLGTSPPATAGHPPGLLEKVNRDRARRGQSALAPGEWTTPDLEEFARHLRNPDLTGLKRRLMR